MFTGLIQAQGRLISIRRSTNLCRLVLELERSRGNLIEDIKIGDSVAVQGVCLTAVQVDPSSLRFGFDLMPETLEVTCLGSLTPGSMLNVEKSLRLGDYLGGHLVSGDIDGKAMVFETERRANALVVRLRPLDKATLGFMVLRGRVAIDGASLTIMELTETHFAVSLIPHTQANIGLGRATVGQLCNIETDLLARHFIRAQAYA